MKLNPFFSPIEQVKQASPSVNPANHASFKVGKIGLLFISTGSNNILPLVTHRLKPLTKISNLSCLLGKTRLPLNKLIIKSISFLFCVTYLLVIAYLAPSCTPVYKVDMPSTAGDGENRTTLIERRDLHAAILMIACECRAPQSAR